MNYRFGTIMSWITYVNNNVWEISKTNNYDNDPDVIKMKFNELFNHELISEYNDVYKTMQGLNNQIGSIAVFINKNNASFIVKDNFNNLSCYISGIYKEFDGKRLASNIHKKGYYKHYTNDEGYFSFVDKEDNDFVFVKSIVKGKTKNKSLNINRLIRILFERSFVYLESLNPEEMMFLDYDSDEKESMIKECELYDKKYNKRRPKKEAKNDEE